MNTSSVGQGRGPVLYNDSTQMSTEVLEQQGIVEAINGLFHPSKVTSGRPAGGTSQVRKHKTHTRAAGAAPRLRPYLPPPAGLRLSSILICEYHTIPHIATTRPISFLMPISSPNSATPAPTMSTVFKWPTTLYLGACEQRGDRVSKH